MSENNKNSNIIKIGLKSSGYILGYLLAIALVCALAGVFILSRSNLFNPSYLFWGVGVFTNILFLNSVGTFSLNILLLFVITIFIMYKSTKKNIKTLKGKDIIIYMLFVPLVISVVSSLIIYLSSLIKIDEFSTEIAIYKANFFISFISIYIKTLGLLLVFRFNRVKNNKLNSGVLVFKKYFYLLTLYAFILTVIAEIYLFIVVGRFGILIRELSIAVIIGTFNIMAYSVLFLYGGIIRFSVEIMRNPENYMLSFLDLLRGEFGSLLIFLFIISFILLLVILYVTLKFIREETFIRDSIIFIIINTLFNGILATITNINVDFSFVSTAVEFSTIPVMISTLLITTIVVIIKYSFILIRKNI
ncbi:hypothetical protein EDC19_1463 [Natranaerovirga hydrolytica]|uniref:Uncharacterized protein n=1 Tax=Natranaerovirga hydrolytica TaxID=680378 RepID=A0A4R1MMY7_9FIRM|nr:hypothetical protein [Natranaerovirga hydrolytica]TCK93272.1 hypothetical protein EDC19_1463 [Natranaerovirga hydrolytica]